jgi:hypothetical protein
MQQRIPIVTQQGDGLHVSALIASRPTVVNIPLKAERELHSE